MTMYVNWDEQYVGTFEKTVERIDAFHHTNEIAAYLHDYQKDNASFKSAFEASRGSKLYDSLWDYLTPNQKLLALTMYLNFILSNDYECVELEGLSPCWKSE